METRVKMRYYYETDIGLNSRSFIAEDDEQAIELLNEFEPNAIALYQEQDDGHFRRVETRI